MTSKEDNQGKVRRAPDLKETPKDCQGSSSASDNVESTARTVHTTLPWECWPGRQKVVGCQRHPLGQTSDRGSPGQVL